MNSYKSNLSTQISTSPQITILPFLTLSCLSIKQELQVSILILELVHLHLKLTTQLLLLRSFDLLADLLFHFIMPLLLKELVLQLFHFILQHLHSHLLVFRGMKYILLGYFFAHVVLLVAMIISLLHSLVHQLLVSGDLLVHLPHLLVMCLLDFLHIYLIRIVYSTNLSLAMLLKIFVLVLPVLQLL
jgi:hypothetical protein